MHARPAIKTYHNEGIFVVFMFYFSLLCNMHKGVHMSWFVYLLECKGGSYYTGITKDLESRFAAHKEGRGARYTRANPPLRILASRAFPDRSTASIAEARVKQMSRGEKLEFFFSESSALNSA